MRKKAYQNSTKDNMQEVNIDVPSRYDDSIKIKEA